MMPAMGVNYALKGATEADISLVRAVVEKCSKEHSFDDANGLGTVTVVDSLETVEYDIGLDISKRGKVEFYVGNKAGVIEYDEADKDALLRELVLMFSGNVFMDVDMADYMPIFEKGCEFSYIDCQGSELRKGIKNFLDSALNTIKQETKAFIQITVENSDGSIADIVDVVEGYNNQDLMMQIIDMNSAEDKWRVSLFI